MAPSTTKAIVLNEPPMKTVTVELGQEHSTFKLVDQELPALKDGQVLLKTLYMSNDPTQRGWIQKGADPARMYTAPVLKGDKMRARALSQVLESASDEYKPGDIVLAEVYWAQYSVLDANRIQKKVDPALPLPLYLSTLGLVGMTAYFGLLKVGGAKKGDTVVVSAASGATGSLVVQVAKAIGCTVVGITGGKEKAEHVKQLGADESVDYRDPDFKDNMKKALGEKGVCDIYFDNVGGEILDVMLSLTKPFGTIVACGAIAGYNDSEKLYVKKWFEIIANRLQVKGFIVIDFISQVPEFVDQMTAWMKEGKVKSDLSAYNVVDITSNFEAVPKTWHLLFEDSKKPGKLLTKIADPEKV